MDTKKRTITLTGRPPVKIAEDDWPVIAHGTDGVGMRNGTPLPDYESASWDIRVRQHSDGRAIVYGVSTPPAPGWNSHGATNWRGGELLPAGEDIPAAIQRVGRDLVTLGGAPESIIRETIADLPAEDI